MRIVILGAQVAISSSDVTLLHPRLPDENLHLSAQSRDKKIEVTLVWDAHSEFYGKNL